VNTGDLMDSASRYRATVVASKRITPVDADTEVREVVFDVDCPDMALEVGQSIGIIPDGAPELGESDHTRLYSIADLPDRGASGHPRVAICVRRFVTPGGPGGTPRQGITSNFLCGLQPGDTFRTTGQQGLPFVVPSDMDATLILIGTGTGIAPFRALVRHIYTKVPEWRGRIWVFHGAKRGLELLYANEPQSDAGHYYDKETFEAFQALSPRPNWADPMAWDLAFVERGEELLKMFADSKTYVYVAGLKQIRDQLDALFDSLTGEDEDWADRKAAMASDGRWVEVLY